MNILMTKIEIQFHHPNRKMSYAQANNEMGRKAGINMNTLPSKIWIPTVNQDINPIKGMPEI